MRNGVKNYYNKNKILYPVLVILFIVFFGFLISFILNSKKTSISLDIASYDTLKDLNFKNEEIIKAEFLKKNRSLPKILTLLFMGTVQMNL